MVIALKLGGLAAAGLLATGAVTTPTCCPTETISCLGGQVSFAGARCNVQALGGTTAPAGYARTTGAIPSGFVQETITCPVGETAMSGGFRVFDLTQLGAYTVKEDAPLAPSGPSAIGYQFIFKAAALNVFKIYVQCQGH
jgi:hypothetical protein